MNAEAMRNNAESCLILAQQAKDEPSRLRYLRMVAAWRMLAENKDWLDGRTAGIPSDMHDAA